MYVTRLSRFIQRSILSTVSRNRSRSWNVLPVDTGAHLYYQYRCCVVDVLRLGTCVLAVHADAPELHKDWYAGNT
jgi:hypothetical protein